MTAKKNKNPRQKKDPKGREIRKSRDPSENLRKLPSWTIQRIDRRFTYGWDTIPKREIWGDIIDKLKHFETMSWDSIIRNGSHNIEVNRLIPEAQGRLRELRLDDLEELFSLHLNGKKRIFGILENGILSILWYDPNHELCPSQKKYT